MEKLQQVVNLVGNNDVALKCLASGQWRTSRAGLINFTACQTSSLFIKTSSCLNFSNANCYRTIPHCLSFITRSVISIWNETPRRQRGHAPQGLAKIYKLLLSCFFSSSVAVACLASVWAALRAPIIRPLLKRGPGHQPAAHAAKKKTTTTRS